MADSESEEYMDFEKLKSKVRHFTRTKDSGKKQTPKEIAESISIEAADLLEVFHSMSETQAKTLNENENLMERIHNELADILHYCFSMANELNINLSDAIEREYK